MTISYEIILTIINLTNDELAIFNKNFETNLDLPDKDLYNNYHLLGNKIQMFALFKNEINSYCEENNVTINNIDIDEFNINSNTDRVDVYFVPADGDDPNQISLNPDIQCYVYPKYDDLIAPELIGEAYDDHTIIWSWEDDGQAHYLISEAIDVTDENNQDKIIAQVPINTNTYTETGLEPDTAYTRRLIAYNAEQTSRPSRATTIRTATAPIDLSLEQYEIPKNYDFTADDSEREIIQENLEAFHSGIGDYNDLKVYKQMDTDFYQKFKAYIQLRGERSQREKRYDSVGFNYKVCLESTETIEEQKGEVTFDIDAFPRENVSVKDYMYATQPVTICARMWCDVLLKKADDHDETVDCPLKEPEWEKKTEKIPNEWVERPPQQFDGEINIVLSLDISGSMSQDDGRGGGMRWDIVKNAAKNLVDQIEGYSKAGIALAGKVKYAVTLYAASAFTQPNCTADMVKQILDSVQFQKNIDKTGIVGAWGNWQPGNLTNHGMGLCHWLNVVSSNTVVELFFTDGFANTPDGSTWTFHDHPTNPTAYGSAGLYNQVYVSVANGYTAVHNRGVKCYTLFGANFQTDCDNAVGGCWTNEMHDYVVDFDRQVYNYHASNADGIDMIGYSSYSQSVILNSMWNGLKTLIDQLSASAGPNGYYVDQYGNETDSPFTEIDAGWSFKGWKDAGQSLTIDADWDIDNCKWVHVVIPSMDEDPWTITLNDTVTPVIYARNEQRAIIPSDSIIVDRNFDPIGITRQSAIQVDSRDIQSMIMQAARQTAAWEDGYNQFVEAYTPEEKKQGRYIIRGLFIKDTYKYADEDEIPDVNFSDDGLEDGYVGSVNVYADINKLGTAAFGDDVYAVAPDKYVWLSGYTDAIIYDGERIESFELNASHAESYDHQTEIIASPLDNYADYLWNRKNNEIHYSGDADKLRHVIDVILKDKDIYITGTNALIKKNDWVLFVPPGTDISDPTKVVRGVTYPIIEFFTEDIVAHNDEHYQSPILNYRFNYEDPDAYTSYYELLPDCDPFSSYKHIIFVHVYYARNIYIQDQEQLSGAKTVYIQSFGSNNIATRASEYYLTSQKIKGQTYFRDDYIDDYIWFQAKPMTETNPYYDEKPNPGMDTFYGAVNGRYKNNNKSGKQDLRVVTPEFNIPTTVDAANIKIYIMITEFYPDTALVAYQWEHPSAEKDSITNVNGDYVTFSSDSLTYKDVKYNELLQTVTTKSMELFDNKTSIQNFTLTKPLSNHVYDHYYIDLYSDNSDVLAVNYPTEVVFDQEGRSEFGAGFKGVVNATTKWSPRIHNGYYYLNQHEYYAYSEFDVDADFEEYSEENYKVIPGYVTIDVELFRLAGDPEHYDILKNTRSELLQNEREFTWITGKGLSILPSIDGEFYKEYSAHVYTSPIILFPHILTSAGKLRVDYYFEDGSDFLPMQVRSYDLEQGKWSEWFEFENDTVPSCPLSCAYQVQFMMAASVLNSDKTIEDYLCCYLDWKEDGDTVNHVNCITINDHLKAGPYEAQGTFNSKIIDFGCESTITIDMFASNINNECALYVAAENYNKDKLLLENVHWIRVDGEVTLTTRFFRYRVTIPYGEKVYWIHKKLITKESTVLLPIVTQIQMTGDYTPVDVYDNFQEIQSFDIVTDGKAHKAFNSIYDIISGDVRAKGFEDNEIHFVRVTSTCENVNINFDINVYNENPTVEILNTPIYATADFETELSVRNTPYIYAYTNLQTGFDLVKILRGTPQQYAPITIEDPSGRTYREVFDVDPVTLLKTEIFEIENEDDRHYIKLSRNDFDLKTFTLLLNDEPFDKYQIVNNLVIFNTMPEIGDVITITYNILFSFYTEIDRENNKTQMTIYSEYDLEQAKIEEISNLEPIIEHHTYEECHLDQIFANGETIVVDQSLSGSDTNWKYDANLPGIYYSQNSEYFSMIINNLLPTPIYEMEIVAYSTDTDDDIIGFVIGYIKDMSNKPHTLTYLVSLGEDYIFDYRGHNTAIVMDYGKADPMILASKKVDYDDYHSWSEIVNGIKFSIKKNNNLIECKISDWNDIETWNEDSILTADLDQNESTQVFSGSVYYGFCTKSQKDTYFVFPVFTGRVDHTVTVEEQLLKVKNKYKVYFETNEVSNKFIAKELSLNPVYRTDYKGFIYLTDEHNEPYKINIYRNPKYIKAGGYDKIDVAIECLDYEDNPVISKDINIDCEYGILNFDSDESEHYTDINGVIHVLYESAVLPCTDTLTARTTTSDGTVIESSVEIINE